MSYDYQMPIPGNTTILNQHRKRYSVLSSDMQDERQHFEELPSIYPPFVKKIDENYVSEGEIEFPFEEIGGSGDENKIRGNWASKVDYFLAMFGYTFALGNLWRFPYLMGHNGGVVYLIPYCISYFFTALPVLFIELAIGQFISLGSITAWNNIAPLFKGIGLSMVFISCIVAIYYNIITAWALYYLLNSLKFILPFSSCGNEWNTDNCTVWNRGAVELCKNLNGTMLANGTCLYAYATEAAIRDNFTNEIVFPTYGVMPSVEYFHNEVLMISSGIDEFRTINWQMALLLLISWFAVFLSSFKGIKSSGKVVYVTVILPYIILLVLLSRFMTLPGSIQGLIHFFKPNWEVLTNVRVWGEAALHVFYSLSTCTGGIITLSSYNRYHNNLFRDIWVISIVDLVTSLLVSTLIFSAIGFVCDELGLLVDQFRLQDGVQLVFIFFSEAISKLPVAPLYSMLFFLMIALIIVNTELFIIETIVSSICDEFPERLRRNHRHVLTFLTLIFYILGIPLCTSAGLWFIVLLETFTATWPLIIIAFFECMVVAWVYGADNFLDNVKWMTHFYPPFYIWWKILWKFICPLLFLAILSFVWLEYKPLHYNTVSYPGWAHTAGWVLSLSPIFFILLTAIYKYITEHGSLAKRWRDLLCPEDDWGPALAIHRAEMFPLQIPEAKKLMQSRYGYKQTLNGAESTSGENASESRLYHANLLRKHESSIPTKVSTTSVERETII